MLDRLMQQARDAVQVASSGGADEAVATVAWGRSLEFKWRDGKVEKVQEDTSRGLSLALYVDGRFSVHSTNDLEVSRLADFVADAIALTRALEPDEHRRITPAELYEGRAELDLELVDQSLAELGRDERLEWCQEMEAQARSHGDVVSVTTGVGDSFGMSAACSSNGFEGLRKSTSIAYGSEVTLAEGENRRPEAWRWVGANHIQPLPAPVEVGKEALRRALARLGATRGASQRTAMVVDREIGSALIGRMLGAMRAGAIQQGRSFLAGRLGERIASPRFSLRDEPHLPRLGGSRLFDSEGIASQPRTVVEEGILSSFFVDTYYGSKLGMEPTSGSASNLVLSPGEHDREALLAEVGEGIYVCSWLGGNANATTGDFSFGVRGHLIRNGKLDAPVEEMNVSGNFLDLFSRLQLVGNDPVPWSSFRVPTLVFEDVQFSGS
ncbi:MAG: peptidase U62 [Rickettsiales bacterium]|nr:peptidase U62 [Rickettsiales bacterium]|tara:strand:- start:1089 stop:2405 length:1317 start_codon:yes stop_codon:yes gene_type:complete